MNRVAIVTGASRGIGAATARAFAQAGVAVALAARDGNALTALAREIEAAGGRALAVPTDVTEMKTDTALIDVTVDPAKAGPADFHFYVLTPAGGPQEVEEFDAAVRLNLRSVFLGMKFEIPAMLVSGGGAIVNLTSTAGLQGVRQIGGYVAAKHGVVGLTATAALEYGARGIRVNAVAPGPILTERLAAAGDDVRAQAARARPLGRVGRPEEVAALVLWLCSDQAGFITGTTIPIEGGALAGVA